MKAQFTKVCAGKRAFLNELFVYESSFPDKAQLIEIQKPHTLILSKLDGIPYLDVALLTEDIITSLAIAISRFHATQQLGDKVLCHWDNQPRNILWDEKHNKVWLVDFEDVRLAHPEADIAHLFLFWAECLDSDAFTKLATCFLSEYKGPVTLNAERWRTELKNAKNRFDIRRKRYCKSERTVIEDSLNNRNSLLRIIAGV